MEFLHTIEALSLSAWVRESTSLFAFPGILLFHTIGMAMVVGLTAAIALRILGWAPALPLSVLEKFFPVLWAGFWINAATGTLLLMADATTKLINPDFYAKLIFIALAVVNLYMIRARVFRDPLIDQRPPTTNAKVLAITSMIFWVGAITAGRLLAYVGPISGLIVSK